MRFETAVYRNATNNDTMFIGLLQSENNCLSRSDRFCKSFDICQTVCLACVICSALFSEVSLNTAFVSADKYLKTLYLQTLIKKNIMIIEPKMRGFICLTSHPKGCEENVIKQIEYFKTNG